LILLCLGTSALVYAVAGALSAIEGEPISQIRRDYTNNPGFTVIGVYLFSIPIAPLTGLAVAYWWFAAVENKAGRNWTAIGIGTILVLWVIFPIATLHWHMSGIDDIGIEICVGLIPVVLPMLMILRAHRANRWPKSFTVAILEAACKRADRDLRMVELSLTRFPPHRGPERRG
jgi:hypothetical protein